MKKTKGLEFTQKDGFKVVEVAGAAWDKQVLVQLGFESMTQDGGGVFADDGFEAHVYQRGEDADPKVFVGYDYIVDLNDTVAAFDTIFVRDRAELLALRIQLASLWGHHNLTQRIANLEQMAKKAFRALHGHDADASCDNCDPKTMADVRHTQAKLAKAEAEARSKQS